jgi:homoserine/homoserine lactone efflux protein
MPFELWLMFVAVSLLPAISPGPAVMLAISNTLRFGRNATLASATGNMMGLIVIGYAVAFGFGALMAASAVAFTVLKIIGAVYLVYIGIKILRDGSSFQVQDGALTPRKSPMKLFLEAFFVSVTNPKAILVITALFPQFMSKGGINLLEDHHFVGHLCGSVFCQSRGHCLRWRSHAPVPDICPARALGPPDHRRLVCRVRSSTRNGQQIGPLGAASLSFHQLHRGAALGLQSVSVCAVCFSQLTTTPAVSAFLDLLERTA